MTRRPAACLLAFAAAAAAVVGCQQQKPTPPPPPPPQVTVARPVSHPVQKYYEYNGFLDSVEMVQVKARVKGFLKEIHFKEGDEVEAGDPLYTIDPREYVAAVAKSKADLAKAKADVDRSKADIRFQTAEVARLSAAKASGAAPETDVEKAQATLDVNKSQLASATAAVAAAEAAVQTAELELEWAKVDAPIGGRISRTLVTKGNLVGHMEATLLTTIVKVDPLYVYYDVPERDLVEYQLAQLHTKLPSPTSKTIPVEVGVAVEAGYPHKGTIDFRENRVDAGTGTVRIRGVIPNPLLKGTDGHHTRLLYPGLYARVRVPSGDPQPRLMVPEPALMTGQEGRYLYTVNADNTVAKKLVTVGPRIGTMVAIEKGIAAEDWVIINGIQKARPDGKSTVQKQETTLKPPAEPAGTGSLPPAKDCTTNPGGAPGVPKPAGPGAATPGANPTPAAGGGPTPADAGKK
jgi:multidrug efflux system membrane fusion protein